MESKTNPVSALAGTSKTYEDIMGSLIKKKIKWGEYVFLVENPSLATIEDKESAPNVRNKLPPILGPNFMGEDC